MIRKSTIVPDSLKMIDVKAILRKRGIYLEQNYNKLLKEAAVPIARELLKPKSKKIAEKPRHAQFTNEIVQAFWEKQIHIVEILEKKFDLKVQQFISKVVDGFLAHLESEIATIKDFKAKDYFDDSEDDWQVQAQLDFTPLLMDQVVLAGQEAYRLIGKKDDVYLPDKLRAKIAENVTKFTQSMLDTDRDTLVKILTDGLASGQSVPEIRTAIQADFDNITKSQAQRITRTEVLRASNQASLDAYKQSGVVEGKQWLTAGADDECADYEGDIVALDDNFYGYDTEFQDGDPPLHPNCRCVILPVLIGENAYVPPVNKELYSKIKELEAQIDKRTKEYKEIQELRANDLAYTKALEELLDK